MRRYLIEYFVIALVLPAPVEVSQPVISIFINIDKMVHQFRVFLFFDLAKKKRKKLEVKDTHTNVVYVPSPLERSGAIFTRFGLGTYECERERRKPWSSPGSEILFY